jgi:signal transduction histidine kinase/ligand-binding sensor domain-containing protein
MKYLSGICSINILRPLLFALLLWITACKPSTDYIPTLPSLDQFNHPTTLPFAFGESAPLEWDTTYSKINKPTEKKLDLKTLPSIPFKIDNIRQLAQLPQEKSFDFDQIPDSSFDLDKLPTRPLVFKTLSLGKPKFISNGASSKIRALPRGVSELKQSMSLPGNAKTFTYDNYGTLWVGTDKGACRYNGKNWEVYGLSNGLEDNNIFSIMADEKNRIWLGTVSGDVYIIDRSNETIKKIIDTISVPGTIATKFVKDGDGRIWFARIKSGISIIDEKNKALINFGSPEGLKNLYVSSILKDNDERIWFTHRLGVNIVNLNKKTIKEIGKANGLQADRNFAVHQDKTGRVWIGNDSGFHVINFLNKTIKSFGQKQLTDTSTVIYAIKQKADGSYLLGPADGKLHFYDEKNALIETLFIEPFGRPVFYNILESKTGELWVGSASGEGYLVDPSVKEVGIYDTSDGFRDTNIWSICEDDADRIWIGTYNGLHIYDHTKKRLSYFGEKDGLSGGRCTILFKDSRGRMWVGGSKNGFDIVDLKKGMVQNLNPTHGIPIKAMQSVAEDKNGNFWITGDVNKLLFLSADFSECKSYTIPLNSNLDNIGLLADSKNQIWLASYGAGLFIIDVDKKLIKRLSTNQGLTSNWTSCLKEGAEGEIWVGWNGGLYLINTNKNTYTSFTEKEGLSSTAIWTLNYYDRKIFAGGSNGLSILSPTSNESNVTNWSIKNYGVNEGLRHLDFAQNGSAISKDQLWAGIDSKELLIFDLPSPDSSSPSSYITGVNILNSQNSVFFNTNKQMPKQNNRDNNLMNQNHQDSLLVKEGKIKWDSLVGPYQLPINLQLSYNLNFLSFNFSGKHPGNSKAISYSYILEGVDKSWIYTSNDYSDFYRDLSPGKYVFKLSSSYDNIVWSQPISYSIIIHSPWWKSWWIYLLYAFLFGGLLYGYIQLRSRSLKKQNQVLEDKVQLRTQQLQQSIKNLKETQSQLVQSEKMASLGELTAGIAHEIQNPLNFINNFAEVNVELIAEMKEELNKGNWEDVKAIADDIETNEIKINHHGKRADSIVKGMLQHSRASSGKKELTNINTLVDEYIRLSYHGLRAKDKSFNATIKTDFDNNIPPINAVPQDLGRAVLNLLTNAFYAASKAAKTEGLSVDQLITPTVWITTKKHDDHVTISVRDNGNGIPKNVVDKIFQPFFTTKPTGQGTGLGLSMSYDIIVKGHGGELKVETKEGEGSSFSIELPIA